MQVFLQEELGKWCQKNQNTDTDADVIEGASLELRNPRLPSDSNYTRRMTELKVSPNNNQNST